MLVKHKITPRRELLCILHDIRLGAVFEGVELDDETEDWEGDTRTLIEGILHTTVQFVAVVWADNQVVAVFLEAIADFRVEDGDVLLGSIFVPEWELRDEASSCGARARARVGIG